MQTIPLLMMPPRAPPLQQFLTNAAPAVCVTHGSRGVCVSVFLLHRMSPRCTDMPPSRGSLSLEPSISDHLLPSVTRRRHSPMGSTHAPAAWPLCCLPRGVPPRVVSTAPPSLSPSAFPSASPTRSSNVRSLLDSPPHALPCTLCSEATAASTWDLPDRSRWLEAPESSCVG